MSDHDTNDERAFLQRTREVFEQGVGGLDGETRSRLTRARARAVDAAGARSRAPWRFASWLAPAGACAAAALAVALIWQPTANLSLDESGMMTDLDILLEGENLELLEDLEFYAWLLEQPEFSGDDEAVPDTSG